MIDAVVRGSDGRLYEPVAATARAAERLAREACGDCGWYHGAWQYLRLADLVSTPAWHERFYTDELRALARVLPAPRILVCGAADYGMLAHVLRALEAEARRAEVTVLDRCATPGLLCRWYAERAGWDVETVTGDVLSYEAAVRFDAVVTHAFLPRFDEAGRADLARRWHGLLRPGGVLVTALRVADPAGSRLDQSPARIGRALRARRADWERVAVAPFEHALELAEAFAARQVRHLPVGEAEVVEALARAALLSERRALVRRDGRCVMEIVARRAG